MLFLIAERLSVRLIIVQVQRALVGSLSEVVLVSMSVCYTDLWLKYTGLGILYVPVWHVMLMMPRWRSHQG